MLRSVFFVSARMRMISRLAVGPRCCSSGRALPQLRFHWVVFSACGVRGTEAARAAELFTASCEKVVILKDYRDGFLPYNGGTVKVFLRGIKDVK